MAIYFKELAWLVGIGILAGTLILLWRRKYSFSYLFCFSVFWIYILLVIKEVFFPIEIDAQRAAILKGRFMSHVNLLPFYFGRVPRFESIFHQVLLNIILTIPFGFGVGFIAPVKMRNILWLAVAVGSGIEATQLVISLCLGYPYRVMDINDILCNTAGVLIGYGFFRLFAWLTILVVEQLKIRPKGLFEYILEVASQAS